MNVVDEKGWLHRKAYVVRKTDGAIFDLTFDIAKSRDGRVIIYATKGKIKKIGQTEVSSLRIKGSGSHSNFDNSILENEPTVNNNSTQNEVEYTESGEKGQHSLGSPMQLLRYNPEVYAKHLNRKY